MNGNQRRLEIFLGFVTYIKATPAIAKMTTVKREVNRVMIINKRLGGNMKDQTVIK